MRKGLISFIVLILFAVSINAGDIYKVKIQNQEEADLLNHLDVNALLSIPQGYIIELPDNSKDLFLNTSVQYKLIKTDITPDQLYIYSAKRLESINKQNILYQYGNTILLCGNSNSFSSSEIVNYDIHPIPTRINKIIYNPISTNSTASSITVEGLDTLIEKISQDSLESYLYRLEAFGRRLTGTDSAYAARDWIENKFRDFGYDSVVIDPFIGSQLWARIPVQSYNVIATKVGTKNPEVEIIIGAHFDAVPDCPGADDNGTGTAAVLEMARIFKDIETDKTIKFITFDSEESWMWGSYHYADSVYAENPDIILMLNVDMIGHYDNDHYADLYTGDEAGYAYLWSKLSDSLVYIYGYHSGSTASDHWPFQEYGCDVVFVQERNFSTEYHLPSDSTTYINFDYMTRMTKGTFATAYTVSQVPPPIRSLYYTQTGDGTSLHLWWDSLSALDYSHFQLFTYKTNTTSIIDSQYVSASESSYIKHGLIEGTEYSFYLKVYDFNGNTSLIHNIVTGTPSSIPVTPENFQALPIPSAVKLVWANNNNEGDFNHYNIYRDSSFLTSTTDTVYYDSSPSLLNDFHEYYVIAVDNDGIFSEESEKVACRVANIENNRILALNRTSFDQNNLADASITGEFLQEALVGYDYDYYSDSAYIKVNNPNGHFDLYNMLDYEIIIIGAESAMIDDIALSDDYANLADYLHYYLSIGGKLIIFGRWGDFSTMRSETIYNINSPSYLQMYPDCFNISSRVNHPTNLDMIFPNQYISAELIGATSNQIDYPDLNWDSTVTSQHSLPYFSNSGIPLVDYVTLNDMNTDVIYSFHSNIPGSEFEDKPVVWKNVVGPNRYVYYDIPLSFFERPQAIIALQNSLTDLMDIPTDLPNNEITNLPQTITLSQNYPNPFNPTTTINFSLPEKSKIKISVFNILGQNVKTLTDELYPVGNHSVVWDGTNSDGKKVSSGIYLYKLVGEDFSKSKKMVLLK